ncbi:hypothetical protein [Enterobacter roggenkampii]|uniref:hypothetical protein n=1 Tax=Enterobacter roggenkampii TaxID=1812935 RepID=UPI001C6FFFAF|nr:hypothetical protein [Enterobacter roggenkampii]MBW9419919.1 hypothetical protein [Enterobacter roggenkampii]
MNDQQVNQLLAAMAAQTQALNDQTVAINRLSESNEALVGLLYQSLTDDIETTTIDSPHPTYLSTRPRG